MTRRQESSPGGHAGLDVEYGLTLGEDAIPALVDALPRLPPLDRARVLRELQDRKASLAPDDSTRGPWAWNAAREHARAALERVPGR